MSVVTLATAPHMLPSSIFYCTESTQVTTRGRKVLRCPRKVDKLMVIPSVIPSTISRCLTPWKENSGKTETIPPKVNAVRLQYVFFLSFSVSILKPVCLDGTVVPHHHLPTNPCPYLSHVGDEEGQPGAEEEPQQDPQSQTGL